MLFITALIFNCSVAYSADIDGVFAGEEWDGAVTTVLLDGESNCGVDFGIVHSVIDYENSAVFLCFMHRDPSLDPENTVTGISLSADGSDEFVLTPSVSPADADSSEHRFDGCVTVDDNNGVTSEVRIGFKYGVPKEIRFSVRFIDSLGALSNVFSFTVINDEYTETTEVIITQHEPEETEKETTAEIEKSTKQKKQTVGQKKQTTKQKKQTTKKSTRKTTVKEAEKTTRTVTEKEKTQKRNTYSRRTKAPKTEAPDITAKTTAAPKPATVYYYEKEVIISQVYVTQTATTVESETIHAEITVNQTQSSAYAEPETEMKSTFSFSEGAKKKTVIGAFAAISFTVIAVAGARSSKKKTDNDSNPDSQ